MTLLFVNAFLRFVCELRSHCVRHSVNSNSENPFNDFSSFLCAYFRRMAIQRTFCTIFRRKIMHLRQCSPIPTLAANDCNLLIFIPFFRHLRTSSLTTSLCFYAKKNAQRTNNAAFFCLSHAHICFCRNALSQIKWEPNVTMLTPNWMNSTEGFNHLIYYQ